MCFSPLSRSRRVTTISSSDRSSFSIEGQIDQELEKLKHKYESVDPNPIDSSKTPPTAVRRSQRVQSTTTKKTATCVIVTGAMYSFLEVRLSARAIEAAKKVGKVPDIFYCLKLLGATGISTVPESGVGQFYNYTLMFLMILNFKVVLNWLICQDNVVPIPDAKNTEQAS